MRNLKFSFKMLVIIGVLVLSAGAITLAAVAQLNTLNSEIRRLVDISAKSVQTAEEMRIELLESIRYERNSTIAPNEEESKKFADTARAANDRLDHLRDELLKILDQRSEERSLVNEFTRNWEEFKKVQRDVLVLNPMNTNAKAAALVSGRFMEKNNELIANVQTFLDGIDRELVAASQAKIRVLPLKKVRLVRHVIDDLHEVNIQQQLQVLVTNERDLAANEKEMSRIDGVIKDVYARLRANLNELRTDADDSQRPDLDKFLRACSDLESIGREVQRLAHENSFVRATELSLRVSRPANVAALGMLSKTIAGLTAAMEEDKQSAERLYQSSRLWLIGGALLALLLSLVLAVWISRSLTQALVRCAELFKQVAKGDLTGRMNLDQTDEIGQLAQAMDQVTETLHGVVGRIRNVSQSISGSSDDLSRVSQGLLSQSEEMSVQAVSVASGTEQMSTNITTMAVTTEEMSVNMTSISSVSEEISVNVSTIAQAADDTTRNVEAVNGAIEGITRAFKTIASDAKEGAQVTDRARQMASHATETMSVLGTAAGEINKVTEVIKMIALQTNLLALNATIEATSAGEAGKGFAVVASEIKELASQSARAAEEITRKIEGIQASTRDAVKVIDSVAQTIDAINSSAGRISDAVANQTQVAQAIFNNVGEASRRVSNIAKSISEVSKGTTDLSRNTSEASKGATDVSRNATEAAKAAERVTANIHEVSQATKESTASAIKVNQSAKELHNIAVELSKAVGQFRLER